MPATQASTLCFSSSWHITPAVLVTVCRRQRLRFGDRPTRRWQPQHKDADPQFLEQLQQLRTAEDAAALISTEWRQLLDRTDAFLGRKLYEYFNWRQDTSKDLLVTFGVFAMLVLAAGGVRRWAVDEPADRAAGNLWADVYQVGPRPCPRTAAMLMHTARQAV